MIPFVIFLLLVLINSCYVLGTDVVFHALFVDNFWTSLGFSILFIAYFILSLKKESYWRGAVLRDEQITQEMYDKAHDFAQRLKEEREQQEKKEEQSKEQKKEWFKKRGKTIKAKYTKKSSK